MSAPSTSFLLREEGEKKDKMEWMESSSRLLAGLVASAVSAAAASFISCSSRAHNQIKSFVSFSFFPLSFLSVSFVPFHLIRGRHTIKERQREKSRLISVLPSNLPFLSSCDSFPLFFFLFPLPFRVFFLLFCVINSSLVSLL